MGKMIHFMLCLFYHNKGEMPTITQITINPYNIYLCCSVISHVLTLWDPMDCSTPGSSVLPYLPEFAQIHVHWLRDAIWPLHPLLLLFFFCLQSSPTLGSFLMSQLFASGSQSIGASASVLLMSTQGWFPLGLTGLISLLSMELADISCKAWQ